MKYLVREVTTVYGEGYKKLSEKIRELGECETFVQVQSIARGWFHTVGAVRHDKEFRGPNIGPHNDWDRRKSRGVKVPPKEVFFLPDTNYWANWGGLLETHLLHKEPTFIEAYEEAYAWFLKYGGSSETISRIGFSMVHLVRIEPREIVELYCYMPEMTAKYGTEPHERVAQL